jgi:DNA ligase (NAD+)
MGEKEEAREEIARLSEQLRRHQHLYYVEARPIISDAQYDRMLDRLIELEREHPEFKGPDSPSQRVGSDLASDFPEYRHKIPVLSLDKAYSAAAVMQWIERTRQRGESRLSFTVEEKIDGVSLVLYYEDGILARAVTRGNGFVGNDVTPNARTISSIPLRLNRPLNLAVRGEVFLRKSDFEALNGQMEIPYANPRNLAAGALRRIRSSETALFPLRMFAYEMYSDDPQVMAQSHTRSLALLRELGFMVNHTLGIFSGDGNDEVGELVEAYIGRYDDLGEYLGAREQSRDSLAHEIDGLVVKVNDLAMRELLGYTGHHPRWALAYKFDAPEAQTVLTGIDVQVGRTGRITPVGRVKSVKVGNSVVSNVTLHNQDYINLLELAIGDTVSISKRGDVIPAVERVVEKNEEGNTTWDMPSACPTCGTALARMGAHMFCTNEQCPDQVLGRIVFFAGREQMDIEGFGPETVSFLVRKGWVKQICDLYAIDYSALVGEPGFGEKKAASLGRAMLASKDRPFRTVLVSLGIPDFGKKAVDALVDSGIRSMEQLLDVVDRRDSETLLAIKGFGEKTVESLFGWFSRDSARSVVSRLREAGLRMDEPEPEAGLLPSPIFLGQVWCVTGSFERFVPRSLALKEIEARGGRTTGSVTRKTTHLLAGTSPGSKLQQALSLGTRVVDEKAFIAMLEGGSDAH